MTYLFFLCRYALAMASSALVAVATASATFTLIVFLRGGDPCLQAGEEPRLSCYA